MIRFKLFFSIFAIFFILINTGFVFASNVEICGVEFPIEKVINNKVLKLNGVSVLKKFGFVDVYVEGLYLEKKTQDPKEVINSEQIKYIYTQYLTDKATSEKIRNGFNELITHCNSKEMIDLNQIDIDKFASWMDSDMLPGLFSETIYIPGEGLTLIYQGKVKGTIHGNVFAKMYYQYKIGAKAKASTRDGLLGS